MATNEMLPFCPVDTGTNLLTQVDYSAASDRTNGNQPGIASARLVNKAMRQATAIASQFAQFVSDKLQSNVLDDGNEPALLAQIVAALEPPKESFGLRNFSFTTSVATSALTIAVKANSTGLDPTVANPVVIDFRSATTTAGAFTQVNLTSALSLVISNGSTLGMFNGISDYIYVYLLNNAGTPELAVSGERFGTGSLQSTTAEGGAGAADSGTTLYSAVARTNVPVRLVGRILISEATAGAWTTNATELSVLPFLEPQLKWQLKRLTANVTTTTASIADWALSNLTIGKTYRVTINARVNVDQANNSQIALINNAVTLLNLECDGDAAAAGYISQFSGQTMFVAAASTATFSWTRGATSILQGNNTFAQSFILVEQVPNTMVATTF